MRQQYEEELNRLRTELISARQNQVLTTPSGITQSHIAAQNTPVTSLSTHLFPDAYHSRDRERDRDKDRDRDSREAKRLKSDSKTKLDRHGAVA